MIDTNKPAHLLVFGGTGKTPHPQYRPLQRFGTYSLRRAMRQTLHPTRPKCRSQTNPLRPQPIQIRPGTPEQSQHHNNQRRIHRHISPPRSAQDRCHRSYLLRWPISSSKGNGYYRILRTPLPPPARHVHQACSRAINSLLQSPSRQGNVEMVLRDLSH